MHIIYLSLECVVHLKCTCSFAYGTNTIDQMHIICKTAAHVYKYVFSSSESKLKRAWPRIVLYQHQTAFLLHAHACYTQKQPKS